MSTNYGKQIAKNKGAVIATFAVAFLATYAVMGSGGFSSKNAEVADAPQGAEEIASLEGLEEQFKQASGSISLAQVPVIESYIIETSWAIPTTTVSLIGTGFSTTSGNLVSICRIVGDTGACAPRRSDVIFINDIQASSSPAVSCGYGCDPRTATSTISIKNFPRKYSNGSPVQWAYPHQVKVHNNVSKRYSNSVILPALLPTGGTPTGGVEVPVDAWTFVSSSIDRVSVYGGSALEGKMTFKLKILPRWRMYEEDVAGSFRFIFATTSQRWASTSDPGYRGKDSFYYPEWGRVDTTPINCTSTYWAACNEYLVTFSARLPSTSYYPKPADNYFLIATATTVMAPDRRGMENKRILMYSMPNWRTKSVFLSSSTQP